MLQPGLGEEDPQALLRRGDAFMRSPGFFSTLLGRGADPDAACSCYMQAAQRYKVNKKWTNAAEAYTRAAAAAQRAGDEPRAASLMVEAGSTLKRVDTEGARQRLDAAATTYIRLGRWGSAGKIYRTIAEMLETDSVTSSVCVPSAASASVSSTSPSSDNRQTSPLRFSSQSQQQQQEQQQMQQQGGSEQQMWGGGRGARSSSSNYNSGSNDSNSSSSGSGGSGSGRSSSNTSRTACNNMKRTDVGTSSQQQQQQQHGRREGDGQAYMAQNSKEGGKMNSLYYYKKAADAYDLDDYGKSACSQCRVKYAELAARDDALLHESIRIYEEEGEKATKNDLLQFSARDFFFRALLLLLSTGDVVSAKIALERYNMRDPRLENSREGQLAAALIAAAEDGDADAFTSALHEYDRITKLDSWKVHFLLRAKRKLLLDGGFGPADDDMGDGGGGGGGRGEGGAAAGGRREDEEALIGEDGNVDLS